MAEQRQSTIVEYCIEILKLVRDLSESLSNVQWELLPMPRQPTTGTQVHTYRNPNSTKRLNPIPIKEKIYK